MERAARTFTILRMIAILIATPTAAPAAEGHVQTIAAELEAQAHLLVATTDMHRAPRDVAFTTCSRFYKSMDRIHKMKELALYLEPHFPAPRKPGALDTRQLLTLFNALADAESGRLSPIAEFCHESRAGRDTSGNPRLEKKFAQVSALFFSAETESANAALVSAAKSFSTAFGVTPQLAAKASNEALMQPDPSIIWDEYDRRAPTAEATLPNHGIVPSEVGAD
jgi:hypothetical protein